MAEPLGSAEPRLKNTDIETKGCAAAIVNVFIKLFHTESVLPQTLASGPIYLSKFVIWDWNCLPGRLIDF